MEEKLGFHQFGRYEQAVNGQDFAYDKIEDLWTIDIDSDSESEEEDEDLVPCPTYRVAWRVARKLYTFTVRVATIDAGFSSTTGMYLCRFSSSIACELDVCVLFLLLIVHPPRQSKLSVAPPTKTVDQPARPYSCSLELSLFGGCKCKCNTAASIKPPPPTITDIHRRLLGLVVAGGSWVG